jgi:hypothetical protein
LDAFEEEVFEEFGDKLTPAKVNELIRGAEEVAAMLDCAVYQPEHDCEEESEEDDD